MNTALREKFEKRKKEARLRGSSSGKSNSKVGYVLGFLFCGVFLAVGVGIMFYFYINPLIKTFAASDWLATTATITSSRVTEAVGDDGSTYGIEIKFSYEHNGRSFISDTYDFGPQDMKSSGRRGKEKIVSQYPAGQQTTCYVNPSNPSDAVILRGNSLPIWWAILPVVFMGVGGIGIFAMFWSAKSKHWATGSATKLDDPHEWLPKLARPDPDSQETFTNRVRGYEEVQPTKSRVGKLITTIIFAVIWNGITIFPVYHAIKELQDGKTEWVLIIVAGVFALVGLGIIWSAVWAFLALSNPQITMRFEPRIVGLGQTLELGWRFAGNTDRLSTFTIKILGIEKATYRRGTDTVTEEKTIFEKTLVDADVDEPDSPAIGDGQAQVLIPTNTMHSLDASNNKVEWVVKVEGGIKRWPDVKDDFEFAVVPASMADHHRKGMF